MDDMTKLAEASVDDLKTALPGLSLAQLTALRAAEEAGKNRSTALAAIDGAIADHPGDETEADQASAAPVETESAATATEPAESATEQVDSATTTSATAEASVAKSDDAVEQPATDPVVETPVSEGASTAATFDHSGPANIPAATEFEPSGAPIQSTAIDAEHPAVDANPRAGTTVDQNRIDFNDPTLSGEEAVKRNLGIGG